MRTEETVSLYRAVGVVEFNSIMESRRFTLRPNGLESKYFGKRLDETIDFANKVFNVHVVAIVEATICKDVLDGIGDFTKVDTYVFKSGTVEIHKEQLDEFNSAVLEIKHMF